MNVEIIDPNDTNLRSFHESHQGVPSYSTRSTAEPQLDIVSKDLRPEPARQTSAFELDAYHPTSTTLDHEQSLNTIQKDAGGTPLVLGREQSTSGQDKPNSSNPADIDSFSQVEEPPNGQTDTESPSTRYFCDVPSCKSTLRKKGYAREAELKRHQASHRKPSWTCGCCKAKQATNPYASSRKDHLLQHLRRMHNTRTSYPCDIRPCHGALLFSKSGCLKYHELHDHRGILSRDLERKEKGRRSLFKVPKVIKAVDPPHLDILPCRDCNDTIVQSNLSFDQRLAFPEDSSQIKPTHLTRKTIPRHSENEPEQLSWMFPDGQVDPSNVLPPLETATRLQADNLVEDFALLPDRFTSASSNWDAFDDGNELPYLPTPTTFLSDPDLLDPEHALFASDMTSANHFPQTSIQLDSGSPYIAQAILEEVREVDEGEFLFLSGTDGYRIVHNLLISASILSEIVVTLPVSYHSSTRTIKLQGPPIVAQQAKLELQNLLQNIRAPPTATDYSFPSDVVYNFSGDHACILGTSSGLRDSGSGTLLLSHRLDSECLVGPDISYSGKSDRYTWRRRFSLPHRISSLMSRLKALKL
ncbi:hypothetical protein MMC27_007937 [Xylographa pallens]|nr:hypothetical protein [Xylographa pallens]